MNSHEASADGATLALRVTDIHDETGSIRSFEFRPADSGMLPEYEAGAHLEVEVELPDGQRALRPYSLIGDQADRHRYRIAVLLEADGRGGSRYLHQQVGPGTVLRAARPENAFAMAPRAEHSIMLAGGIGITPILSMIRTLERQGQSFEVHYTARTPMEMAFRETIGSLDGGAGHLYYSRVAGHQSLDLRSLLANPKPGVHLYVCGPRGMIRSVLELSGEFGWPRGQLHFESFGAKQLPDDRAIDVHLALTGITVRVAPGETILEALLKAGVWAPSECGRGECGSCMTRLIDGEPDHRDVCLSQEMRSSYLCTCVSRARSGHLTLDL